jgi:hypothetical protein
VGPASSASGPGRNAPAAAIAASWDVGVVDADDLDAPPGAEERGSLGGGFPARAGDLGDRRSGNVPYRGGEVDQFLGHGAGGREPGRQVRHVGDVALPPVEELPDELVELRGPQEAREADPRGSLPRAPAGRR